MAVQVQLRRGSETDIASFKGAQGEIVMDTTNNRLILCDGTTQGGVPLAKLSEVGQEPLAATQIIAQSPHGAAMTFEVMEEMIALSGNSNQSTIAIPARAIVFAVSVLVVTGITGATHFNVDATLSPNGAAGARAASLAPILASPPDRIIPVLSVRRLGTIHRRSRLRRKEALLPLAPFVSPSTACCVAYPRLETAYRFLSAH